MRLILTSATALVALSIAAHACPDLSQTGASYSLTGEELYSPQSYTVIAGGDQSIAACDLPGVGHVISSPDFTFTLSGMAAYERLEIEVTSADCDTVLLVNAADATWHFDDDSTEDRPVVNLSGAGQMEGRVDVWVGTYGETTCEATLEMETW